MTTTFSTSVYAALRAWRAAPFERLGWFERERFPRATTESEALRELRDSTIELPRWDAPRVSVIIPVHGKFATTWHCLKSLASTDAGLSFEVLLVDDASPDSTPEMLKRVHNLRVLTNPTNQGYVRANNLAAREARGEFLCLLNNDTLVTENWLAELAGTFSRFDRVGLVGAKLLFPDGRLQEAGGIVFGDGSCANYGRWGDPDRPEYGFVRAVDYCSAACVLVKRDLWETLGGFDEHFVPAYYEDTDLAFRVREHGYRVLYQPLARVAHYHGMTHGRNARHGKKRSLLVNKARFRERWQTELARHPLDRASRRLAAERAIERRHLIITDRAGDTFSGTPLEAWLERARTADELVSIWPRNTVVTRENQAQLARHGIEVLRPTYAPTLGAALGSGAREFDTVVLYTNAPDEDALCATIRARAPRAHLHRVHPNR